MGRKSFDLPPFPSTPGFLCGHGSQGQSVGGNSLLPGIHTAPWSSGPNKDSTLLNYCLLPHIECRHKFAVSSDCLHAVIDKTHGSSVDLVPLALFLEKVGQYDPG